MPFTTLKLTRTFDATPKAVYRAFTTPGGQMDWFANAAEMDARVGGRFYLWTEVGYQAMGTFTTLEEDRLIAWDMHNPASGQVQITLSPENGQTTLTIEQNQLETEEQFQAAKKNWETSLKNLKSVLETGLDRRFYDRPMIGILIAGMVDKEIKERLQLTVDYGILLGGTLPGMGAEAAGLAGGDVLVEMDGIAIKDYHALHVAVTPHKAGDTVHLVWYRGAACHEADMTLSGRKVPHIPATPAELAEETRQLYARLDAELAEILEGITEEEAEYCPAETEWNSKEILAHIITTERAVQIWIINALEGTLFHNWASNNHELVKSIVDIHPTLPRLVAELRRTEGQTVALLQRLPPEILDLKGAYHNIATYVGKDGLPVHTRLHYDTIKNQIEEARK